MVISLALEQAVVPGLVGTIPNTGICTSYQLLFWLGIVEINFVPCLGGALS